ncbi:DUF4158 domain-containing protein [Streptomyces lydicus]|uniref:DUF4158 domain-containing protein n=1 Tax=Streptomyces lydicus TaxID=47763 RepID=UPI0037A2C964
MWTSVTRAHDDQFAAAGLDQADALGDVKGLPDGVGVPGGAGAGRAADHIQACAGGSLAGVDLRLITAHELHLFFSPTRDELQWAADRTDSDEHLPALLLTLKSYQRMGCFPKVEDIPEAVAEFVRRAVELPEGTLPVYRAAKTMKNHRGLVRQRVGVASTRAGPGGSPRSRSARRPRRRTGRRT